MTRYAICTLDLKWTKDAELRELFTAIIPLLKEQGVTLQRSWIAALGTYRKVVSIWEADSHSDFLAAAASPALQKYHDRIENLGAMTVDLATRLVDGPQKPSDETRRGGGIIFTGTVDIVAGKAKEFAEILIDSLPTMASHGVLLEASYQMQVGDRCRVLDVWWAPDANSCYAALSDPILDAPAEDLDYSLTLSGELVEVHTELKFA